MFRVSKRATAVWAMALGVLGLAWDAIQNYQTAEGLVGPARMGGLVAFLRSAAGAAGLCLVGVAIFLWDRRDRKGQVTDSQIVAEAPSPEPEEPMDIRALIKQAS